MASSCENPQFPTWTWRYNRDKHLTPFENWMTRVDQWPPRYRHMGVPYGFQFTPGGAGDGALQELGVTYAKHLKLNRETGFGNAGLGNPPGPAPPRLQLYNCPNSQVRSELYRVNEVAGCSDGMSLWDYSYKAPFDSDINNPPLDPKKYLKETLNQDIEYPCQYPHFQLAREPLAPMAQYTPRRPINNEAPRSPLEVWRDQHQKTQRRYATERASFGSPRVLPSIEPGVPRATTSEVVMHHKAEGDRRWPYPLANF